MYLCRRQCVFHVFGVDIRQTMADGVKCWATVYDAVSPKLTSDNHVMLDQCWLDVGPPSATVGQHCDNIGSTPRVFFWV